MSAATSVTGLALVSYIASCFLVSGSGLLRNGASYTGLGLPIEINNQDNLPQIVSQSKFI